MRRRLPAPIVVAADVILTPWGQYSVGVDRLCGAHDGRQPAQARALRQSIEVSNTPGVHDNELPIQYAVLKSSEFLGDLRKCACELVAVTAGQGEGQTAFCGKRAKTVVLQLEDPSVLVEVAQRREKGARGLCKKSEATLVTSTGLSECNRRASPQMAGRPCLHILVADLLGGHVGGEPGVCLRHGGHHEQGR
jgi:hypothetical protein